MGRIRRPLFFSGMSVDTGVNMGLNMGLNLSPRVRFRFNPRADGNGGGQAEKVHANVTFAR